jgi:hypothetical protein
MRRKTRLETYREIERSARRNQRIIDFSLGVLFSIIFGFFMAWLLINWAMGCGEYFYTADGSIVYGECWLHTWEPPTQ